MRKHFHLVCVVRGAFELHGILMRLRTWMRAVDVAVRGKRCLTQPRVAAHRLLQLSWSNECSTLGLVKSRTKFVLWSSRHGEGLLRTEIKEPRWAGCFPHGSVFACRIVHRGNIALEVATPFGHMQTFPVMVNIRVRSRAMKQFVLNSFVSQNPVWSNHSE